MKTHELKTWPEFFEVAVSGEKTFELRKDDRAFRAGDFLLLREWMPNIGAYTGREMRVCVTYLMCGPLFGLQPGWVCMAIMPTSDRPGPAQP